MERWWNDTDWQIRVQGEKPVLVLLCP